MKVASWAMVSAAASAWALPLEVGAQAVRVRLLDAQDGGPVRGALVALVRAGRTVRERLTDAGGEQVLVAPSDSAYVVEVRRVGFAPYVSQRFTLTADTPAVTLRVPPTRVVLRTAGVTRAQPVAASAAACRPGEAERTRSGTLWQQMATALKSLDIAHAEGLEPLAIDRYERTLSRAGEVLSQRRVDDATLGARPFRTPSAEELMDHGFVVPDSAGQVVFRAPDAGALLSDAFAAAHCFTVVSGSGPTSGMLGLRFEPVPARRETDVEGFLWADEETAQLRSVEFRYRLSPPADTAAAGDVGGRILFEQLPSGYWIAREWVLRTPVLTSRGQVLGHREEGGEAMTVTPRMRVVMDSIAAARRPPGVVTGVVYDSLSSAVFEGARVWLDSSGPQTTTDARGLYFLRGVPPGPHLVRFAHPLLDSLGIQPRGRVVTVASDALADASLGGPSLHTLTGGVCGDSLATLTGQVSDAATGEPVDSAGVTVTWIDIRLDAKRRPVQILPRVVVAHTDASGRYGTCVPARMEITGHAARGAARTARVDLFVDARRLGILSFTLDASAPDTLTGSAFVRGVVKYQDGTPIRNAAVTLTDPELSATTDSLGRFRLPGIPGGTRVLDARAVGHAPTRTVLELRPGDTTDALVYLRRVTTLDPILVQAAANDRSAETLAALAERRRRHQGTRVSPGQLQAFKDAQLDAVLRSLPWAQLRTSPALRLTLQDARGRDCRPTVWLDGRRSDIAVIVSLRARDVLSLEVMRMRGEVPVEFQEFSDCGAVLVWMQPATLAP